MKTTGNVSTAVLAFAAVAFAAALPVSAAEETEPALSKIVAEYENTYGPLYLFWSDRNQLKFSHALIEGAQQDGKITPEEGRVIEKVKLDMGPTTDAAELLFAAQHAWMGKACGSNGVTCTPTETYAIKAKFTE